MVKITFILFSFFYIHSTYAVTEKASIVFTAGLNEITDTKRGGYAQLASLLEIQRKKTPPTFFIFGGASLFPSILSSFDHGAHIIDLLNSLEPDAMAASNGDFAFSEDELSLRTYEAAFPVVQSNIVEIATKRNLDGLLDSVIMRQGPYQFGFISLMDKIEIETYNLKTIKSKNSRSAIVREAQKSRAKGADFIIMHYQGSALNCIDFLNNGTVDLVLRKNSNIKRLTDKKFDKHPRQIILTEKDQAAIIQLSWQGQERKTLKVQWQAKSLSTYPKNSDVQQQIENYTGQLNLLLDEIIGVSAADIDLSALSLRAQENGFANLVADLIKKHGNADIALINSGAFRGESFFAKNSKISRRDIIKTFPYRNRVVLLNVSGAQLVKALENGFSQVKNLEGRFPQVSGMKIVYNSQAEIGQRVVSVIIDNSPLEPLKHYKLATIDFLAEGGDGYLAFKQSKPLTYHQQMSKLVSDILISELQLTNTISSKKTHRITDTVQRITE